MLRKLLKYEFRASLLILPICLVAMALLYGAGWAAKAIGISQLATTCAVFLALVGCASVVVALITAILRFYKGVFAPRATSFRPCPWARAQSSCPRRLPPMSCCSPVC